MNNFRQDYETGGQSSGLGFFPALIPIVTAIMSAGTTAYGIWSSEQQKQAEAKARADALALAQAQAQTHASGVTASNETQQTLIKYGVPVVAVLGALALVMVLTKRQ